MFLAEEIRQVVDLQQKSHALLKWVNDALRSGTLTFTTIHEATTLSEAAADWLRRHLASLPPTVRPTEDELIPFAHLFVSYLSSANYLLVRTPEKKAIARASEMKMLYLSALAEELAVPLPPVEREALLSHPTLAESVTYATYGTELLRRSRFASQGEGVLVLWREIAWTKGRLRKGFVLSPDRILTAEAAIIEHLRR